MIGFKLLLALHVLSGTVAILAGPVPMLSRKGGPLHRKLGQVFSIAMWCGAFSAFGLAVVFRDKLLLTIAVLVSFLIFSGVRAARFRRQTRPGWMDEAAYLLLAGFGVWLLCSSMPQRDITGMFFGAGSLVLAARHWQLLRSPRPDWLLAHIAGMGGAYVASVVAVLVVNLTFLPKPVVFILPTLIGTMLISWASFRHATRPVARIGAD